MSQSDARVTGNVLLMAAACVVVIAGVKSAASILIPFLLAVFIAILSAPVMRWLTRHRVPEIVAVLLILVGFLLFGTLLATFVGRTINAFYQDVPLYETKLQALVDQSVAWVQAKGIDVSDNVLREYVNPGAVMKMVANVFNGLGGVLANTFLILFTVIFILLEATGFPAKLRQALGDKTQALKHFARFSQLVQKYLVIKTLVSLMTGTTIGIALWIIGVDYAAMWALVAFLLNYIPNIGSIIAAVPAVLVALIQLGVGEAAITAAVYVFANTFFGNIVEPKMMGRTLGLSTLVVFLSLVFWGWVLGPVGMLLSIPLTMVVKIAFEVNERSRWVATLLDQ
ncbi:MAG: AI-2E family transporter [Pseudomonadota bacterium]|nr:AI-2E family transporter [Pseudomonadota bacterium]